LGGRGYSLLGFYIHDVRVKDAQGKVRNGVYCPVMFENMADPIITGREELIVPKLYSDIAIDEGKGHSSVKIGWGGHTYAEFSWQRLAECREESAPTAEEQESEGSLVHRYMPSHEIGKAICTQDVLLKKDSGLNSSIRSQRVSVPTDIELKVEDLGAEFLPTLHHVVSRLAELPVFEVLGGSVTEYHGVTNFPELEVLSV